MGICCRTAGWTKKADSVDGRLTQVVSTICDTSGWEDHDLELG